MKDIKQYFNINEASSLDDINLVLGGSGSMYQDGPQIAKDLLKLYPNANLFLYEEDKDEIIPLNSLKDYKSKGPHTNKFDALAEFYKAHLGEMTIFVQN